MDTYTAQVDAVGGSLGLSALVGLVPLVVFFICLVGLKRSAWLSGLIALAVEVVVALAVFGIAFRQ